MRTAMAAVRYRPRRPSGRAAAADSRETGCRSHPDRRSRSRSTAPGMRRRRPAVGRLACGPYELERTASAFDEGFCRLLNTTGGPRGQVEEDDDADHQPGQHDPGRCVGRGRQRGDADAGEVDAEGGQEHWNEDQGAQDRNRHVEDGVELVAMLANVEDKVAEVGEDVDDDDDERRHGAQKRESVERRTECETQDEGDSDSERALDVYRDVGSFETWMYASQGRREDANAAERIADPRRCIRPRVGVGERAVDDRDQNEDREWTPHL